MLLKNHYALTKVLQQQFTSETVKFVTFRLFCTE